LLHWVAKFSPSLWEEEDSGAWQEVVREVELEVWKKGKGVFGILLLLQKKKKKQKKTNMGFVLYWREWTQAFLYMSPFVFSAIGIALSVGVSVLGAAW
jgi:hypothetical protein